MATEKIFIPSIHVPSPIQGEPPENLCGMNERESAIFGYMRSAIDQQRPSLLCHEFLVSIARSKASDMAIRGYEGHLDPGGFGANHLLRMLGYRLPKNYGDEKWSNNVESCGWGGDGTAEQIWDAWMDSPPHKTHLLGLNDTHRPQIMIGVGHYYKKESKMGHYWVVLSAHPE